MSIDTTNLRTLYRRVIGTRRRGVVAILAMMFLVLFGSLGLAMTIASQGNLRTASTHQHVSKAISAAETGLAIASARLAEAAGRFVIDRGVIDGDYGRRLWDGSLSVSQGRLPNVLAAPSGFTEGSTPRGVAQALVNQFSADANVQAVPGGTSDSRVVSAPSGVDSAVFRSDTWVVTPAVAIDGSVSVAGSMPAAFSIMYAPLANGTDIRIYATGYSSLGANGSSFIYGSTAPAARTSGSDTSTAATAQQPITRTIYQDFRMAKRHKHLAVSPARILVGKNVSLKGNIGVQYSDVAQENGDPLLLKSDFYGLDSTLDRILNDFFAGVKLYDADADNRLRANHAGERRGLPSSSTDYDADGNADNAFADANGDGFVDDFDLFINFYDGKNGGVRDGQIALSDRLRAGTPNSGLRAEFTVDDDLALMIDSIQPDRNNNGVLGFVDSNNNGRWDSGEMINDYDSETNSYPDVVLGWRDGVIDRKDPYTKVRGKLMFRTTQSAWTTARGDYRNAVQGSIAPLTAGQTPIAFNAGDDEIPALDASSFADAVTDYRNRANGQALPRQVESQRGLSSGSVSANGTTSAHVESRPQPSSSATNPSPRYFPMSMDNNLVRSLTGQNLWERTPFNAPSFADWYVRPRYENMTFTNVTIPRGNNGLYVNCRFIGVTFVDTETANTHQNWQLYGKMTTADPSVRPTVITSALDKSDFTRWTTSNVADGPSNYSQFPDPPRDSVGAFIVGVARDTKPKSNNIRFHNCLFVGTISSSAPLSYTHVRNKLQFTGSTRFTKTNPDQPNNASANVRSADVDAVSRSSMMVPGYSVDIGHFNAPTDMFSGSGGPPGQNVQLQGTIVTGLIDVRGNTTIDGTLLATYAPTAGQGSLLQYGASVGNPANFNISLGHLGPADGDRESLDPALLPNGPSGRKFVGWDLDADGLPDTGPVPLANLTAAQRLVAREVPFYGYGKVELNWNPDLPMPNGIMLPVSVVAVRAGYGEGKP